MPADLLKAHKDLDVAVDRAYGIKKPFASESERLEFLFGLYQELISKDSLPIQSRKTTNRLRRR